MIRWDTHGEFSIGYFFSQPPPTFKGRSPIIGLSYIPRLFSKVVAPSVCTAERHTTGGTMNGIVIELVSDGRGRLVGKTASCRWNLAMLGLTDMADDGRNGASLKRARRMIAREWGDAFTLTKVRAGSISLPSAIEVRALGVSLALAA